ncbi:4'-phosphopantetheinyl transferase family protein [Geodermatophilus amargosae]|uniref:4'-phosphopantetheinyl transferase family protein n=1 Tax=Geodermatophilus amargosae TaxID=1296565 RepID=UPI000B86C40F|nr:4'-phosphopantetheinyl transferase superfamily protein [Geodermatophilus amargosae]
MIDQLLPPAVASAEAFDDLPGQPLPPEEEAVVARATPRRRAEFTTGRSLARRVLGELGCPSVAVASGECGVPVWPAEVVGSITHCDGYRAAVAARAAEVPVLGVDAEPALPLPPGVLEMVARREEQIQLARLTEADPSICWDRLLFCTKEAVYKAWFPVTQSWLGFEDTRLIIGRDGTFRATILGAAPWLDTVGVAGFSGRWLVRDGLMITAASDCRWTDRAVRAGCRSGNRRYDGGR